MKAYTYRDGQLTEGIELARKDAVTGPNNAPVLDYFVQVGEHRVPAGQGDTLEPLPEVMMTCEVIEDKSPNRAHTLYPGLNAKNGALLLIKGGRIPHGTSEVMAEYNITDSGDGEILVWLENDQNVAFYKAKDPTLYQFKCVGKELVPVL